MTTTEPRSGAALNRHRSFQSYETPLELIAAIEKRFGKLSVDLAATKENAKAPVWIPKERDSLTVNWHEFKGLCFLNPEFNNIAPWARKCRDESNMGAHILFLVPASVGSNWFAEFVNRHALVMFLRPRLSFDGKNSYPKDIMLCEFGPDTNPGFECWKWK